VKARGAAVLLLALSGSACAGAPEVRGGSALGAGAAPEGRRSASYTSADCRDSRGGPALRPSRVVVLEGSDGRRVVVEERPGTESLVVENSFSEGPATVFQAVIEASHGPYRVHEFWVPADPAASGRVRTASRWRELELPSGAFRAYLERPELSCTLAPAATTDSPIPKP